MVSWEPFCVQGSSVPEWNTINNVSKESTMFLKIRSMTALSFQDPSQSIYLLLRPQHLTFPSLRLEI